MEHHDDKAVPDSGELPAFAEDGTDMTLIRWALDLTPAERLRAFEAFMADVLKMVNAAHRA